VTCGINNTIFSGQQAAFAQKKQRGRTEFGTALHELPLFFYLRFAPVTITGSTGTF
jgi:hypothetical protein